MCAVEESKASIKLNGPSSWRAKPIWTSNNATRALPAFDSLVPVPFPVVFPEQETLYSKGFGSRARLSVRLWAAQLRGHKLRVYTVPKKPREDQIGSSWVYGNSRWDRRWFKNQVHTGNMDQKDQKILNP